MNITLIRKWFGANKTISELHIDGKRKLYALEDVVRKEGVKVQDKTAIPYGKYKVTVSHSPRLGRRLPLINDVPMFTGIRIHAGIDENWSSGCILISDKVQDGKLVLNRQSEKDLVKLIDDAIAAGEDVTINITNAQRRGTIVAGLCLAFFFIGFICIKLFTPQK